MSFQKLDPYQHQQISEDKKAESPVHDWEFVKIFYGEGEKTGRSKRGEEESEEDKANDRFLKEENKKKREKEREKARAKRLEERMQREDAKLALFARYIESKTSSQSNIDTAIDR